MSNKPDGGPAFPCYQPGQVFRPGMTLRDYFAAKAMAAFIQREPELYQYAYVAQEAYEYADAMLKARES